MARTSNLDIAIAELSAVIQRKEQELAPARERLLILERARQVLNGEDFNEAPPPVPVFIPQVGGRPRGRPTSGENPYAGLDPKKLKGLSIRDAVKEIALYNNGRLVTRYAGQILIDAGLTDHKISYKAGIVAYGAAAHSANFKKSGPGQFDLTPKGVAAGH